MKWHWFTIAIAALLFLPQAARAAQQADDAPPAVQSAEQVPASTDAPSWRYRRHSDLWWYWLPSEHWVYWSGDHWITYDKESYQKFLAERPAPAATATTANARSRTYSYRGSNNYGWGKSGPPSYDRYGNRQYPYSMRNKGIKQIGIIPAPAGVRSWPGWGGAR